MKNKTKEEFEKEIKTINENELKSSRYWNAYIYLANNYWNRRNLELENELFKIIGVYGLEKDMINESNDTVKLTRLKIYSILNQFMDSLTEEQIDSNIFLKTADIFIKNSNKDCLDIINHVNNFKNIDSISMDYPIPQYIQNYIPEYINTQVGIEYYKPEDYKIEYIDVLDLEHKYVYDDYNLCVKRLGKILEDIYFLEINNILYNNPNLICYHFQVYHPGDNNKFIVGFFNNKENNNTIQKKL